MRPQLPNTAASTHSQGIWSRIWQELINPSKSGPDALPFACFEAGPATRFEAATDAT